MRKQPSSLCMSFNIELTESEEDGSESEGGTGGPINKKRNPDPRRWYVLSLYCFCTFSQVIVWNTWSPIANSALFAFPSWGESTIALLNNWGCLMFLLFIGPCCWLLSKKGLKTSFILASILSTLGTGIRLLPSDEQFFTTLAHCGGIFNAIGGVSLSPTILLLSSTWFPPHQRTSATGIGTSLSMLGIACSYVLGPSIVSEPPRPSPNDEEQECARQMIREQISVLLYINFLTEVALLFLICITFPARPYQPPSRSCLLRLTEDTQANFIDSIAIVLKNRDFWLLSLSAGLCSGITGPWLSLLTIIFAHTGITQTETARLGFWTIICSCCLGLSVSKVSDSCPGNIRTILLILIACADFMFLWILLLTTHIIPFRKSNLIMVVIGGLSIVWASPALFYELGAELTFPVQEGIVAGCMMALNNFAASIVYLQLYIFPNLNISWMNYGLFIFGLASFVCLFFVREKYNRLRIDSD